MRRVWLCAGAMVGLWLAALVIVWSGLFVFVGTAFGMIVSGVAWIGLLAVVVVLGVVGRRRWLLITGAAVTVVLAAATFNWAAVAPRTWFEAHRSLYEHAARTTDVDDSYYGSSLPFVLRPLTSDAHVSKQGEMLFFPLWQGIPDDAGGYFYSPTGRSPAGRDMYGDLCSEPVDLGDGWWMCGMSS